MNLLQKLRAGLARTRDLTIGRLSQVIGSGRLDARALEELEEILLEADVGVGASAELIKTIQDRQKASEPIDSNAIESLLTAELTRMLDGSDPAAKAQLTAKPWVILLIGVNGSGKTTTAGKLAYHYAKQGRKSVIAAADTFRAAAVEQLEVWADRSGARFIRQAAGADPASVAFDAYQSALAKGDDILIVDTAGRLQAKKNLMDELSKVHRVLGKFDPTAPHEVLLVLDATTGQNGLSQARGFDAAAGITGLVVTKLDGTARAGIIIPIRKELGLPVKFIGLGEQIDDIQPFDPNNYVKALLER